MIFKEGMKRGLIFFLSSISACSPSRILLAMAVPSILVAPMTVLDVEKKVLSKSDESRRGRGKGLVLSEKTNEDAGEVIDLGWAENKLGCERRLQFRTGPDRHKLECPAARGAVLIGRSFR